MKTTLIKYMHRYIRKREYPNIVHILSPLPHEKVGFPLSLRWTSFVQLPSDAKAQLCLWHMGGENKKAHIIDVQKTQPILIENFQSPGRYLVKLRFSTKEAVWPSRKVPLTLAEDTPSAEEFMNRGTGRRIYCAVPWIKMNIGRFNANPCCNLRRQVRIPYNSDEKDFDPWNSEGMVELRRALLRGDPRYCHPKCRSLKRLTPKEGLKMCERWHNRTGTNNADFNRVSENFLRGETVLDTAPLRVKMTLNHYCNQACVFCSRDTRSSWRAGEGMWSLLKKYKSGLNSVSLTGGEPLLFIQEIQDELKEIEREAGNIHFEIQTNGSLVLKCAEFLSKLGNLTLNVSFNAGTREGYRRVHRRDHFYRVIEGIKRIRELRVGKDTRIRLKMVTMKSNYEQIPDFAHLAADLGVDGVKFTNVLLYSRSDIDETEIFDPLDPEWKEAEQMILEAQGFLSHHGIHLYYTSPGDNRDDRLSGDFDSNYD